MASRWSLVLSVVALAVALYFGLQGSSDDITYCYDGVDTTYVEKASVVNARCFTVHDGRFTRIFSAPPSQALKVEHRPGYAIPGLWDGHGHLLQYGEFLHSVDLFGSSSPNEVRSKLRDYLDSHPDAGSEGEWLRGVGWDQMALGGMPTAAQLEEDDRLKGLHIMLDRVDVHCVWVSQAVLNLLPDNLEDVPGGEIVRDPGMGVFCDNAMDLVTALWPKPGKEKKQQFVRAAMQKLHQVGLVGMHDAGTIPADLELFQEMSTTPDWTLRVYAMLECTERNTFCPSDAARLRLESPFLTVRSVKLFADGALGSWGSAMIEPYADRPDASGSLLIPAATLTSLTKNFSALGFQVNIHAIGDLANRLALDAFEAALVDLCPQRPPAECQASATRFRVEHAQILAPRDQARLRALAVLPSVQPTHATSDMAYAERRLGAGRTADEAYRLASFAAGPGRLVLGSDFPVEPPDPFQGIYAAVARRSPHTGMGAGGSDEAWFPGETLLLRQALEGFTAGPAYGAFLEGQAGVIQDGAFADWVVLDHAPSAYGIESYRSMKVKETWVGGKLVYERDAA
jgi:predicted amidohydrolase YtcJ